MQSRGNVEEVLKLAHHVDVCVKSKLTGTSKYFKTLTLGHLDHLTPLFTAFTTPKGLFDPANSKWKTLQLLTITSIANMTCPVFEDEQLDSQGQNVRLSRLYTQLCLCFSTVETDSHSTSDVIRYVKAGLNRLVTNFPWAAGHVVVESSVFKIKPFRDSPQLSVKDLRNQLPAFHEYRARDFPFLMLDENIVAPRNTLPERFDEPAPVLLLQVTFVHGGLLLVVNGQHNCMDFRGQAQIIHLLAKACRGESYTEDELRGGNLPRRDIVPLLDDNDESEAESMLSHDTKDVRPRMPIRDSNLEHQSIWAYFLFSRRSLESLKALAVDSISSGFVSTDDVLSAFIWQSITRIRLDRWELGNASSTLDRQVDARNFLGIPATYTGNVVHKVSTTLTMRSLCETPLGSLASRLRTCLQSKNIAHDVRYAATTNLASRTQTLHANLSAARSMLPTTHVRISSWAKEDCYYLDFGGLLGRPEAVRRPSFKAWEGLVYLLPKKPDGEIAVALCLREKDVERLKNSESFSNYCSYAG